MGYRISKQAGGFMVVDPDSYEAQLERITEAEEKYGLTWTFYFRIMEEGDFDGATVSGKTSAQLRPGNKLDNWLKSLGVDTEAITIGEEFDSDDIINAPCKVIVENTKNGDKTYSKVTSVLPSKKEKKVAAKKEEQPKPQPKVESKPEITKPTPEKKEPPLDEIPF